MISQASKGGKISGLIAILLMAGFWSTAQGANPTVRMKVDGNPQYRLIYDPSSDNTGCPPIFKDGDICIPFGTKPDLHFILLGPLACDRAVGAKWKLKAFYLGGEGVIEKPTAGISWGGLSVGAADDFNADRTTGLVPHTVMGPNNFKVGDKNNHEVYLWYKVEAVCMDGTDQEGPPIAYDPRVRNGGG